MRKLVSVKQIDKIKEIKNADKIELAIIGGWQVVVKKNEFKEGDKVLYFEIDSFLPENVEEFKFLSLKSSKTIVNEQSQDVTGHILRTVRLRGEISQGLILPLNSFGFDEKVTQETIEKFFKSLGVFKYEKPLPISNEIVGNYPSHTIKTDSERVQNLSNEYLEFLNSKGTWIASEKIDGASTTWWKDENGKLRLASRNYEIALLPESKYTKLAEKYKLNEILEVGDTMKAELAGEGIQGNPLKIQGNKLFVFEWESFREIPEKIKEIQVPFYEIKFPKTIEEALEQVNGLKSLINPNVQAEGIVWWNKEKEKFKELGYRPNFKAINNNYLLKSK